MRFQKIQSVNTFIDGDLDHLRAFYEGALDLPFMRRSETRLELYPGETQLAFLQADGDTQGLVGRETGMTLRCRNAGDLARFITRLRTNGFECRDEAFGPFRGGHRLHLQDPAGNWLTLFETDEATDDQHLFDGPSAVTVRVRDIRRALAFYTMVLELPMLDQPDPFTAVLFPGGTNLILTMRADGWSPAPPISGETGLLLSCDDPQALVDHLRGQGVRFAEEPTQVGDALMAGFRDPDGNHYLLGGVA